MHRNFCIVGLSFALTAATAPPRPADRALSCAAISQAQVVAGLRAMAVLDQTGNRASAKKELNPGGIVLFGIPPVRIDLTENHINDGEITENSYYFTSRLYAKPADILSQMIKVPGTKCQRAGAGHICTFAGSRFAKWMDLEIHNANSVSVRCTYMFS